MLYSWATYSTQEEVSFAQAYNGRGRWVQLLESFWATRILPRALIYRRHALIFGEICHNIKSVSCRSFCLPSGSSCQPQKNALCVILWLSASCRTGREEMEPPWLGKPSEVEPRIQTQQLTVRFWENESEENQELSPELKMWGMKEPGAFWGPI